MNSMITKVKTGDIIWTEKVSYDENYEGKKKAEHTPIYWIVTEIYPYFVMAERVVRGQTFRESFDYGWLIVHGYEPVPGGTVERLPERQEHITKNGHHNMELYEGTDTCTPRERQRRKERASQLYRSRKAAGLCVCCGGPNPSSFSVCDKCREKHRKTDAEKSEIRRKNAQKRAENLGLAGGESCVAD